MPLTLFLICIAAAATALADSPSPTINKCCSRDEILQPITLQCRPISTQKEREASWMPVVFSPAKGNFLVSTPPEWKIETSKRPSPCPSPVVYRAVPTAPTFVLFANGSLVLPSSPSGLLHPDNFCLDAATESETSEVELAAIVCMSGKDPPDTSESLAPSAVKDTHPPTVRKCCGDGAAYNGTSNACAVVASEMGIWSAPPPLRTVEGFPRCPNQEGLVLMEEIGGPNVSVSTVNGSLKLITNTVPPEEFCVERVFATQPEIGSPIPSPRVFVCSGSIPPEPPLNEPFPSDEHDIRFTLYPIFMIFSAIFLAATLAVGYILPKAHHALHWRCQTGHVASLFVGYVLLASTQLAGSSVQPGPCVALGVFMHYSFLAAFFWLNTMCFNIWWTFRDLRPASLDKGQELCRFRVYSVYAWGAPFLITGLGLALDLAATDENGPLRPRFGERRCWFYGEMDIFAYFYGPVGALLLVNLILFLATARELTCGLWRREVSKSSPHGEGADRATLGRVCLKLVVVMGVTWVADVISWAVGGPAHAWYATDLINAFQGVLIFAVVGCQPQVWSAIRRMWCCRNVGGNGGHRRRELGDRAAHDDDDDYDESGAVGRFCRGGAGGGVTSSSRPISSTTSEAGPLGSSPPHSLTWEGEVGHKENNIHKNADLCGLKSNEKQVVEDKETLC